MATHNARCPVAAIHMGIVVPGLSGASFDAWDSVLRTVEDPGKVFFLPFILTIVVVIVSSRGGSKKCKKCTYNVELMFT